MQTKFKLKRFENRRWTHRLIDAVQPENENDSLCSSQTLHLFIVDRLTAQTLTFFYI